MSATIKSTFWKDPDIMALPSNGKLAAAWILTNETTNIIGVSEPVGRIFAFETGLPENVLDDTVGALPRSMRRFGKFVWIVNYIRHNHGSGESLVRNNSFKGLVGAYDEVNEPELKKAIEEIYPEISDKRRVKLSPYEKADPLDAVARQIYQLYPLKVGPAAAILAIRRQLKKYKFQFLEERTRLFAEARAGDKTYVPNPSTWFNQQRFLDSPETWLPRADIVSADVRLRALDTTIKNHVCNPESLKYNPSASDELKTGYKKLKSAREDLLKKIAIGK